MRGLHHEWLGNSNGLQRHFPPGFGFVLQQSSQVCVMVPASMTESSEWEVSVFQVFNPSLCDTRCARTAGFPTVVMDKISVQRRLRLLLSLALSEKLLRLGKRYKEGSGCLYSQETKHSLSLRLSGCSSPSQGDCRMKQRESWSSGYRTKRVSLCSNSGAAFCPIMKKPRWWAGCWTPY